MLSARECRSVDVAAAQLIAREAGASVKFGELRARRASTLDLEARFPIAAGARRGDARDAARGPARGRAGAGFMSGIVDWGLAERAAVAGDRGAAGSRRARGRRCPTGRPRSSGHAPRRSVRVAEYAGLGEVGRAPGARAARPPRLGARTRSRPWPRPRRRSSAGSPPSSTLPGPLGTIARRGAGAAIGAEAGLAAGYAAARVLGQYDVALFGRGAPAAAAVRGARTWRRHGRSSTPIPRLFLRWVALHERTHVVQFERVGWLTGAPARPRRRADRRAPPRASTRRALATRGRAARSATRASWSGRCCAASSRGCSPTPSGAALLDRLQATMSVIEGHAEHVMDAVRRRSRSGPRRSCAGGSTQRRARRGGLGELIARLLGMDLKLRQYELGKAFCDRVVADGGRRRAAAGLALARRPARTSTSSNRRRAGSIGWPRSPPERARHRLFTRRL